MARTKRIQTPGLIRHIMARGNGRMPIFLDDWDYRHFVYLLASVVVEKFDVECWNYCAMPNHYHATLKPNQPNLSEAIRRLNSAYAIWWNRRHNRVGHVFQGRFKAQIVQQKGYLLTLCRYVVLNPVRAGLAKTPEQWPWSSYSATVGLRSLPPFLLIEPTFRQFGDADARTLRDRYIEFVSRDSDDVCADDRIRSNERIVGDKSFKQLVGGVKS